MQWAVNQRSRLGHEVVDILGIAEIGRDVMGPVRVAFALLRHRVTRARDDPPTGLAKALDSRVPDPAARSSQQQDLPLADHPAPTRRGKLERGSSIPSGSWWMMTSALG